MASRDAGASCTSPLAFMEWETWQNKKTCLFQKQTIFRQELICSKAKFDFSYCFPLLKTSADVSGQALDLEKQQCWNTDERMIVPAGWITKNLRVKRGKALQVLWTPHVRLLSCKENGLVTKNWRIDRTGWAVVLGSHHERSAVSESMLCTVMPHAVVSFGPAIGVSLTLGIC